MPDKMKRASLVQGGITRLLNTSIELGIGKQNEVLSKYMKKLQSSNYDHKTRLEILKAILHGWKIIQQKAESGERPLHRGRNFRKEERKDEKEKKKVNWYKGKDGNSFDSVMMIPATPDSILKKIFEEKAKEAKLRIKIVEKSGMKLGSYLKKYDRSKQKGPCGEKDCLICKHSTKMTRSCRIPSVVYKITCIECEKMNVKAKYYGETCFNGYTRGIQHQSDYRSKSKAKQEKSALRKHAKEFHEDKRVEYKMEIVKSFRNNPLARQVFESVKIVNSKIEDDIQLNNKDEFNQAMIVTAKYSKGVHSTK